MRRKSRQQQPDDAQRGFDLQQLIAQSEAQRRLLMLNQAEYLLEIYDKQLYKGIMGDPSATWSSFLAQPSVYFSRNQTYNLFLVAKKFMSELQVSKEILMSVPIQRLIECKDIVNPDNHLEIIEQAKQLTPGDWKVVVREAKGLPTTDSCPHEEEETYQVCKKCGFKHKN